MSILFWVAAASAAEATELTEQRYYTEPQRNGDQNDLRACTVVIRVGPLRGRISVSPFLREIPFLCTWATEATEFTEERYYTEPQRNRDPE
jgi:hypothetical protein